MDPNFIDFLQLPAWAIIAGGAAYMLKMMIDDRRRTVKLLASQLQALLKIKISEETMRGELMRAAIKDIEDKNALELLEKFLASSQRNQEILLELRAEVQNGKR